MKKAKKKKKNADGKDLEGDGLLSEPLMDSNRNIIAGVLNEKIEDEGAENLSGKIGKDIADAYGVGDTQSILDVCKWMKTKLLKDSDDLFIEDIEATVELAEEALDKAGNAVKDKLEEKELNAIDLARREIEKGIIPNGDLKGFKKQEIATKTKAAKTKSKSQATVVSDESLDYKNPFEDSDDDDDVVEVVPQSRSKRTRR